MPYLGGNVILRTMAPNVEEVAKQAMTYTLQEGVDIVIENNVVTQLLKSDYSMYGAVAFPEGITGINLVSADNPLCGQPFIANKVIMPLTLKTINDYSFANDIIFDDDERFNQNSETIKTQNDWTWEDASVNVKVKEFVLNEGIRLTNNTFYLNIYLEKINLPTSCTEIISTFMFCWNLKNIVIPLSIKFVSDYAFMGCDSLIMYGYADTAAQEYATNNNIPFVVLGDNYLLEE